MPAFNSCEAALEALAKNRFLNDNGIIRPFEGVRSTKQEMEAIHYLFSEWDFGYDPTKPATVIRLVTEKTDGN